MALHYSSSAPFLRNKHHQHGILRVHWKYTDSQMLERSFSEAATLGVLGPWLCYLA